MFLQAAEKITGNWLAGYNLLSADLNSLARTVDENLSAPEEQKNLHARTEFDNIYYKDLPTIRKWLLEEGTRFHDKARSFLAQYDQDIVPDRGGDAGAFVVLGAFSHIETVEGEENEHKV